MKRSRCRPVPDRRRLARLLTRLPEIDAIRAIAVAGGAHAFAVGGFVRDALAGRDPVDLDLAVDAVPSSIAGAIAGALGGSAFVLDEARETWRVSLRPPSVLRTVDVARLRGNVNADLRLRDFTVDALAVPILGSSRLIDPTGGLADIERAEIRLVSAGALRDDGLRLLRAIRLAAELGYTIARPTWRAMRRDRDAIEGIAWERRREELVRLLATRRAAWGLSLIARLSLLDGMLPELEASRGVEQPIEHTWDVLTHQIKAVQVIDDLFAPLGEQSSAAARRRTEIFWGQPRAAELRDYFERRGPVLLKLACLLHDAGKPATKAVHEGRVRFFGHAELGSELAGRAMRRLRFSNREVEEVSLLVKDHLRPGQLAAPGESPTRRALYRFFRDLGDLAPELLVLNFADAEATLGPRSTDRGRRRHAGFISAMLEARAQLEGVLAPKVRLVTGHDMMAELGVEPGPRLGRILGAVHEAIGVGEITTREQAIELARSLLVSDTQAGA